MLVHEQIYTSAAQLLGGGANLGVVAESRGFPKSVANLLAPFRAYSMLPGLTLDTPGAHPARLVLGPMLNGTIFAITRTVFAGADHTGRTTPLTHHLLFNINDARGTANSPFQLVRGAMGHFVSAWTEPPRWIDPPRELNGKNGRDYVAPDVGSLIAILPWLADAMSHFGTTGRSVVLVIRPDQAREVEELVLASLALLPASLQWGVTVATHAVAVSDFVREASVLVTYRQASLLEHCRQRRDSRAPLIIDLTDAVSPPAAPLSAWGMQVKRYGPEGTEVLREEALRFDAMKLSAADLDAFGEAVALSQDLAKAPVECPSSGWNALATRFGRLPNNRAIKEWVSRCATDSLRALAADEER